jgi:hypothetical protein
MVYVGVSVVIRFLWAIERHCPVEPDDLMICLRGAHGVVAAPCAAGSAGRHEAEGTASHYPVSPLKSELSRKCDRVLTHI